MKKRLWIITGLLIIVATVAALSGCKEFPRIIGSNNIETRDFDYSGFTRIDISHAFTAEIVQSDNYQVEVTLNDNLFDYLSISRSGNTLTIKMDPMSSFLHTTQHVKISLPDLVAVTISGASHGTVTGFADATLFDLNVSGASRLEIDGLKTTGSTYIEVSGASRLSGNLDTVDGDFTVSGASTLELSGSATDVKLDVSGASHATLGTFKIVDTSVSVTGASSATIDVSGRLDLNVSGASRLIYSGNATLGDVEVSGASTLNRQ